MLPQRDRIGVTHAVGRADELLDILQAAFSRSLNRGTITGLHSLAVLGGQPTRLEDARVALVDQRKADVNHQSLAVEGAAAARVAAEEVLPHLRPVGEGGAGIAPLPAQLCPDQTSV